MADSPAGPEESTRVAELLRVNAELAAELRSLLAGRTEAPRSAPMPTARRLGTLLVERDAARAERDRLADELAATRTHVENVERQRDALEQRNAALLAEVTRLRTGLRGAARRLRARLLRG